MKTTAPCLNFYEALKICIFSALLGKTSIFNENLPPEDDSTAEI